MFFVKKGKKSYLKMIEAAKKSCGYKDMPKGEGDTPFQRAKVRSEIREYRLSHIYPDLVSEIGQDHDFFKSDDNFEMIHDAVRGYSGIINRNIFTKTKKNLFDGEGVYYHNSEVCAEELREAKHDNYKGEKEDAEKMARTIERKSTYYKNGLSGVKKFDKDYNPVKKGFLSLVESDMLLEDRSVFVRTLQDEKTDNFSRYESLRDFVSDQRFLNLNAEDFPLYQKDNTGFIGAEDYKDFLSKKFKKPEAIRDYIAECYSLSLLIGSNLGLSVEDSESLEKLYSKIENSEDLTLPPSHKNPIAMLGFKIVGCAPSGYGDDIESKMKKGYDKYQRHVGFTKAQGQRSKGLCLAMISEYDHRCLYLFDFRVQEDLITLEEVQVRTNSYEVEDSVVYPLLESNPLSTKLTINSGEEETEYNFRVADIKTIDVEDLVLSNAPLSMDEVFKRDIDDEKAVNNHQADRYVYSAHPNIYGTGRGIAGAHLPHNPFKDPLLPEIGELDSVFSAFSASYIAEQTLFSVPSISKYLKPGEIIDRRFLGLKAACENLTNSSEMTSLYCLDEDYIKNRTDAKNPKIAPIVYEDGESRLDQPLWAPKSDKEAFESLKETLVRLIALDREDLLPEDKKHLVTDAGLSEVLGLYTRKTEESLGSALLDSIKKEAESYTVPDYDKGEPRLHKLPDRVDPFLGITEIRPVPFFHASVEELADYILDPFRDPLSRKS